MADEGAVDAAYYGNQETDDRRPSVLWYYLGILRRRFWVIFPVVLVFGTMGVLKAFRAPELYRAQARLLVERTTPQLMQFEYGLQDRYSWDPDYYRTQTQLLRSRAVMDIALENPRIKSMFEGGPELKQDEPPPSSFLSEIRRSIVAMLGATPAPPPEPWQILRAQIMAEHVPETHFIEISVVGGDPDRTAVLANAAAEAYRDYHHRRKVETLGEAFVALQREKVKEEEELLKAEMALQEFRESAEALAVDASTEQPAIERLNRLNEQLTEVQLERIALSAQIGVMRNVLEGSDELSDASEERLFTIPAIQDDEDLAAARRNLAEAEKEVGVLGETYGQQHPLLQEARTKVALLKEQFKKALREIMNSQENRLQMMKNQETELQAEYAEQKQVALDLAKETFTYTRLQNEVDRHRRLFDALVERMREVDVTSGLAKTNVQIVEAAAVPTVPIGAGKNRTIALAIFVGFFLGGGLAFLIENLDDTVKTPEDLRERLDLPLLGFVPAIEAHEMELDESQVEAGDEDEEEPPRAQPFRDVKPTMRERLHHVLKEFIPSLEEPAKPDNPAVRRHRGRIVLSEPTSSVAEAYRSIRASLFYSTPAEEMNMLSITSCRPQEGKTTTSGNLAICIAQTGKRVLLIDGDLHRPSVHRNLGIKPDMGLTSVLVGECSWQDAIAHIEQDGVRVEGLDVLAAGPMSPNPSELLNSTRMKELLKEVRRKYDWVLVDTPPVLFVSDARILSVLCDGVLIVVKAGTSTRSLLARAREQLDLVHARVIGSVLNNVRVSRMGRHYSTYYSYGYSRYAKDYKSYYYQQAEVEIDDAQRADRRRSGASPLKTKTGSRKDRREQPETRTEAGQPLTPLEQASMHLEAGNPGRARKILATLVESRPDQLDAWEMLFTIAYQNKDVSSIETHLKRYVDLRSASGHVYELGLAYAALLKHDSAGARAHLDAALAMRPDHIRALEASLRVDLMEGDVDAASRRVDVLLAQSPSNAYGLYVRGTLHLVHDELDEAEAALRESLEHKRSPEALNDLAWLLNARGELAEAEQTARSALELDAGMPQVWDTLGTILIAAGRLDDARSALSRAHSLNGDDASTILMLADLEVRRGDIEEARKYLDQLTGRVKQLTQSELVVLANVRKALA